MHMLPQCAIDPLGRNLRYLAAERVRCSAVGVGFHLPSLVLFLTLLVQTLPPGVGAYALRPHEEADLHRRISGSVFDPSFDTSSFATMDAAMLADDIRSMFEDDIFAAVPWKSLASATAAV